MEKFNQGLLGELRNMTWSIRLASRINSPDSKELALDKYNAFDSVKDAAATMQLSQEPNKQRALALLNRDALKGDFRKHADLKPLLKQTQLAYVKGFIGSCLVNTHIGIDANNAAPYTLVGIEAFYRHIINELDVTFGSKKRPTPHIRIKWAAHFDSHANGRGHLDEQGALELVPLTPAALAAERASRASRPT
ncbi:hypothetical protein M885DRAFT_559297 [Pelagophyceae sp. CCMP2097]|nr:hypothetical protein M885DRAFT_559297 [Pelagophyceae sp. CCMP2097]